ncbi:hypothetical protein E2562_036083 [Oryza meyeriana var. granulata]|uniref:Uncharacterized protein n=1 Tax=Oryza meyeriana var. granulata TaxID=110450 RepID=A0A6G1CXP7_9ORYZ|nr:hypothetical protein E2562_036083 [Oryza meyeriana var. granulata]KAF0904684.1 hypothetical protein E2562_036083 [Oryza meyeriana var. granulata]KAF0904685.1 hypothetical protein E2562_036083 [Oryza meyeriana var. granulata]
MWPTPAPPRPHPLVAALSLHRGGGLPASATYRRDCTLGTSPPPRPALPALYLCLRLGRGDLFTISVGSGIMQVSRVAASLYSARPAVCNSLGGVGGLSPQACLPVDL